MDAQHLPECSDCRLRYDDSGLPALLRTLTMADVEDIVAPTELPEELCQALIARASARRHRRTRKRLLVTSAAAAVLVAGVLAGEVVHNQVPSVAVDNRVRYGSANPHARQRHVGRPHVGHPDPTATVGCR